MPYRLRAAKLTGPEVKSKSSKSLITRLEPELCTVLRIRPRFIEEIAFQGYGGDSGPATGASLNGPVGIAIDSAGDLYIADSGNNRVCTVSNGVITTVAGNGIRGYGGDNGPATSARLSMEFLAVDSAGNLYIADGGNHRIRMVANGVITTVAGNGSAGYSGDDGPATSARLNVPAGVAIDSAGNLYIADWGNHRVRRVSNGVITTVAGNGTQGYSGDNGPATSAQLNHPHNAGVDSAGTLYIVDTDNDCIRMLVAALATVSAASFTPSVPLAPGVIAAGFGAN